MVVVAGVEDDPVLGPGGDDTADHVERAVAVERRNLDRHHPLERREAGPEGGTEIEATDGRLEVEADQRNLAPDGLAVGDERVVARALERSQADQGGVIAETGQPRLGHGLGGAPQAPATITGGGASRAASRRRSPSLPRSTVSYRPASRIANWVVCTPTARRRRRGVEVVASQGALATRIEDAPGIERERVRRDGEAFAQASAERVDVAPVGEVRRRTASGLR